MAKKEKEAVHPLVAIEALGAFNSDVVTLVLTVQTVADLLQTPGANMALLQKKLTDAAQKVQRHYESAED